MGILIRPIITEKMTEEGENMNKYAFIVDRDANKIQIKEAVESSYDVTVVTVNTMVCGGKNKTRYTKTGIQQGRTKIEKKAIITVKSGEVIDFYSNI